MKRLTILSIVLLISGLSLNNCRKNDTTEPETSTISSGINQFAVLNTYTNDLIEGFDFSEGEITIQNKDIYCSMYSDMGNCRWRIHTGTGVNIAELGYLEIDQVDEIPTDITYISFIEFETDAQEYTIEAFTAVANEIKDEFIGKLYAIKTADNNYGLFRINNINIEVSEVHLTSCDCYFEWKYQSDGSLIF